MNSGLYARAGASATATAAACVNRLLEPMTNVSNVYLGFRRASRSEHPVIVETGEDALVMWANDLGTDEMAARRDALAAGVRGTTVLEEAAR